MDECVESWRIVLQQSKSIMLSMFLPAKVLQRWDFARPNARLPDTQRYTWLSCTFLQTCVYFRIRLLDGNADAYISIGYWRRRMASGECYHYIYKAIPGMKSKSRRQYVRILGPVSQSEICDNRELVMDLTKWRWYVCVMDLKKTLRRRHVCDTLMGIGDVDPRCHC